MHWNLKALTIWTNCLRYKLFVFLAVFVFSNITFANGLPHAELQAVAEKIYLNETGGNEQYLVTWNTGEVFASLGIGHFIWFPENTHSRFSESFPQLLKYLQQQGIPLPIWLSAESDCPWQTQQEFNSAKHSEKMASLRALLLNTKHLQAQFMLLRMQNSLPKMLANTTKDTEKNYITRTFSALSETQLGLYSLIDYVNFKGEGTSATERYKGQGWGLLQVLQEISVGNSTESTNETLHSRFSKACKTVLTRRVANSEQQQVEQKWLVGWLKRCDTYQH